MFSMALIVATLASGVYVWNQLSESIATRSENRSLLITWEQVYSTLKDVETGVRGFVLTEDEGYLAPHNHAQQQLPKQLSEIARLELLVNEGFSNERFADFQKLANEFLGLTSEIITVMRREGQVSAIELVKSGVSRQAMDKVRDYCEERIKQQDLVLRTLDTELQRDLNNGGRSIAALGIAAIIAGFAAWTILRDSLLQAKKSERLAEEKLKAERANREKSTFLATMSHEIRTPMNAILGFGELLESDARDEKQQRYAASIVRSGQALLQLINDILDLSKIEAGMIEINTAPVNVRELAEFTRQLFAHQLSEKGVELRISVEEDVPASLLVDGVRLRQIVLNLVGNAIKFTNEGHVALRFFGVSNSGQRSTFHLQMEVEDTGVGIPADRIGEIFEPFVQAKASRDTELKGTGLGLAIVKRLASLMGGSVKAESVEGHGTKFTVDLPRVEISARLASPTSPAAENVDFDQLHPSSLLVVDDNPVNLSLVRGYFDSTHHTVHTASNGREALDWLASNRPDLVLMDIRMPVMDGRTALAELRKTQGLELLPVIAVTASSMAREEGDLRQVFDGYVRKPFSRSQLFEEMSQFIKRHEPAAMPPAQDVEDEPAEEWRPMVAELRRLQASSWISVKDAMVMSEISSFATTLAGLGQAARCPRLLEYAARLNKQAEGFALDDLEKSIGEFPALVDELEQRLPPSVS